MQSRIVQSESGRWVEKRWGEIIGDEAKWLQKGVNVNNEVEREKKCKVDQKQLMCVSLTMQMN